MKGFIKWFDPKKGYGFIKVNSKDLFFHFSSLDSEGYKTIDKGKEVSFSIIDGRRGKQADKVVAIS